MSQAIAGRLRGGGPCGGGACTWVTGYAASPSDCTLWRSSADSCLPPALAVLWLWQGRREERHTHTAALSRWQRRPHNNGIGRRHRSRHATPSPRARYAYRRCRSRPAAVPRRPSAPRLASASKPPTAPGGRPWEAWWLGGSHSCRPLCPHSGRHERHKPCLVVVLGVWRFRTCLFFHYSFSLCHNFTVYTQKWSEMVLV